MECETPSKTPGAAVHVLGREELVGRVLDYLNCEATVSYTHLTLPTSSVV